MGTLHAIRVLVLAFDDEYGTSEEVFVGTRTLLLEHMGTMAHDEFVRHIHTGENDNTCYSNLPAGHLWERIKSWYVKEVVKL